MKKIPSKKQILKKNPQIDQKKLEEGLKMFEDLRKAGLQRRGYRLLPPYSGRRVRIVENSNDDSHTVRLPHNR